MVYIIIYYNNIFQNMFFLKFWISYSILEGTVCIFFKNEMEAFHSSSFQMQEFRRVL